MFVRLECKRHTKCIWKYLSAAIFQQHPREYVPVSSKRSIVWRRRLREIPDPCNGAWRAVVHPCTLLPINFYTARTKHPRKSRRFCSLHTLHVVRPTKADALNGCTCQVARAKIVRRFEAVFNCCRGWALNTRLSVLPRPCRKARWFPSLPRTSMPNLRLPSSNICQATMLCARHE